MTELTDDALIGILEEPEASHHLVTDARAELRRRLELGKRFERTLQGFRRATSIQEVWTETAKALDS